MYLEIYKKIDKICLFYILYINSSSILKYLSSFQKWFIGNINISINHEEYSKRQD